MRSIKLIAMVLLLCLFSTSVFAMDNTVFLNEGDSAPNNGYLVAPERLEKSVRIADEYNYLKKYTELQEKYYEEKMKNQQLTSELEMKVERERNEAVQKDLAEKLAKKSAFYRQPWFTIPATIVSMLLLRIPLAP